jgi:hypothetical protein
VPATGPRQLVVMDVVLQPGSGRDNHCHPGNPQRGRSGSASRARLGEIGQNRGARSGTTSARSAGRSPVPTSLKPARGVGRRRGRSRKGVCRPG